MRHVDPLKNDKKKIISLLEKIISTERCQLHRNSAKFLLKLGLIEELEFKENWGIGIATFKFHVLSQKGKIFYDETLKKKS